MSSELELSVAVWCYRWCSCEVLFPRPWLKANIQVWSCGYALIPVSISIETFAAFRIIVIFAAFHWMAESVWFYVNVSYQLLWGDFIHGLLSEVLFQRSTGQSWAKLQDTSFLNGQERLACSSLPEDEIWMMASGDLWGFVRLLSAENISCFFQLQERHKST